ncbi:CAP domain-containing protein [Mycena epipterygia]|nr:CAP domain-containing protein [Mycena epipterygia]
MIFITVMAFATLAMALATPNTHRNRFHSVRHAGRGLLDIFETPATKAYLAAHNTVRAQHGAADLVWNTTLAIKAKAWANTCKVVHSDGTLLDTPYGENIVAATGDFGIAAAVKQFTLDESDYNPANPTYNHFTQVVWKSTTQLGCAMAHCEGVFDPSLGQASYYVCLYDPAGNVIGAAPANVQV